MKVIFVLTDLTGPKSNYIFFCLFCLCFCCCWWWFFTIRMHIFDLNLHRTVFGKGAKTYTLFSVLKCCFSHISKSGRNINLNSASVTMCCHNCLQHADSKWEHCYNCALSCIFEEIEFQNRCKSLTIYRVTYKAKHNRGCSKISLYVRWTSNRYWNDK